MQIAGQPLEVREARRGAIAAALDGARAIERERGVTREALAEIERVMIALGEKRELFPHADFEPDPDADGNHAVYLLSEDEGHRFALYMSTANPGKKVPPHNHTTWAVISGVDGEELNVLYERTDDGSEPGRGQLRESGSETVVPGSAVSLMPEDIHHIQTGGVRPTLHLHLYGLALTELSERVTYDIEAGTYRAFPASPNIRDAR